MSKPQPIAVTREGATELVPVSKDTITRAINSGKLKAKRTGENGGGLYLISVAALHKWFNELEDA